MARFCGAGRLGFGLGRTKVWVAVLLALVVSASGPYCAVQAQGGSCLESCKAAFGACYKQTANRAACEQNMQRCLEGCIHSRR